MAERFGIVNDVKHPSHYCHLPIECIEIAKHFNFSLGNVIKYIYRADHKLNGLQDLEKALFYLQYEISERKSKRQHLRTSDHELFHPELHDPGSSETESHLALNNQ